MMFVPRYRPHVAVHPWLTSMFEPHAASIESSPSLLRGVPTHLASSMSSFDKLRAGLLWYFESLKQQHSGNTVLLPAQICPVVPHAIQQAGLQCRYVDAGEVLPMPDTQGYLAQLDDDCCAVLLAPLYGLLEPSWQALAGQLPDHTRLVLDFAQFPFAGMAPPALLERASLICFSFGIGKGLDTGGALLLGKATGNAEEQGLVSWANATSLVKSLTVRGLIALGAYRYLTSAFESAAADTALAPEPVQQPGKRWLDYLERCHHRLRARGELAQLRTRSLAARCQSIASLRHADRYFCADQVNMRQLIRLRDPADQARLIRRLRQLGIDCAIAGEPHSPALQTDKVPRAKRFCEDTIRLPFLGSINEREFRHLAQSLEQCLVECI